MKYTIRIKAGKVTVYAVRNVMSESLAIMLPSVMSRLEAATLRYSKATLTISAKDGRAA